MKKIFVSLLFLFVSLPSFAQFYNYLHQYSVTVEEFDFLFTPTSFSTLGSDYSNILSGQFSGDNIHSIYLNPAQLTQKDAGYVYLDVYKSPEQSYEMPIYYLYDADYYQPHYSSYAIYLPPQKLNYHTKEPVLSTAFFVNPFKESALMLGASYQLIELNENFTQLYTGNYNNLASADFAFNNGINSREELLSGRNSMHHTGHFLSAFSSYPISSKVNAGLKISFNFYQATGTQTSPLSAQPIIYYLDFYPTYNLNNSQQRDIGYTHWDINTGLTIQTSDRSVSGISLGYLVGDFKQNADQYSLNNQNIWPEDDYYLDTSSQLNSSLFNRHGGTFYSNLSYQLSTASNGLLTLNMQISRTGFDLGYASKMMGYNNYSFQGDVFIQGENIYEAAQRSGNSEMDSENFAAGDNTQWNERFTLSYQSSAKQFVSITTGFQLNFGSMNESYLETGNQGNTYTRNFQFLQSNRADSSITSISSYDQTRDISNSRHQFALNIPLLLDFHLAKSFTVQSGVIAYVYNDIFKNSGITGYSATEYDGEGNLIYEQEYSSGSYHSRLEDSQAHIQFVSSVAYTPSTQVRLKLLTASSKINPEFDPGTETGFTFRLALELKLK